MRFVLTVLAAYLAGSIPFGYLIVRAKFGADVRESGSGGTGATNVSRRAGKAAGILTLVLDGLKGTAAVWLARVIGGSAETVGWFVAAAAVAAIVGHIFPLWLGFRGGKGVATGAGVFLSVSPLSVGAATVLFVAVMVLTRYVSLASITAALFIPVFLWLQNLFVKPVVGFFPIFIACVIGAILIVFAHRANIGRLFRGTEAKFR